jgi:hypothetical protein
MSAQSAIVKLMGAIGGRNLFAKNYAKHIHAAANSKFMSWGDGTGIKMLPAYVRPR